MIIAYIAVILIGLLFFVAIYLQYREDQKRPQKKETAASLVEKHTRHAKAMAPSGFDSTLATAMLMVAPIAPISLGISAGLFSLRARHKEQNALKKAHMDDEWITLVSEASSDKGKLFVAKLLKKQGHITVAQANEWLEIEKKEIDTNPEMSEVKKNFIAAQMELKNKKRFFKFL